MTKLANISPGEVLKEDYLTPLNLSQRQLAREINVPPNRITQIINGKRSITAETALLLGNRFKTSPQFWLNLQNSYDLEEARNRMEGNRLKAAKAGSPLQP